MRKEEELLRTTRAAEASRLQQQTVMGAVMGSGVIIALVGGLGFAGALEMRARTRAEKTLSVADELRARMTDTSIDCICVLDLAGGILSMNSEGQRRREVRLGSILNTPWTDLWGDEGVALARQAIGILITNVRCTPLFRLPRMRRTCHASCGESHRLRPTSRQPSSYSWN